eukprot:GHVT01021567.1.p1 GENE.GHVT01021567.1~~GHVT01021567.1.p1  ORF type:complete len:223 (-),score=37.60 GHVT01021567.1:106-681(-)
MATRSCELRIINRTTVSFYLHMHYVYHGVWMLIPIECIAPHTETVCQASCTRSFGAFEGKIQYSVVLQGLEYILQANFEVPVMGENAHSILLGNNRDPRKLRPAMPPAPKIFQAQKHGDDNIFCKVVVTVVETAEGALFLQHLRRDLLDRAQGVRLFRRRASAQFEALGELDEALAVGPPPPPFPCTSCGT